MAAVRHQLDFPGINCRQCNENYWADGVEPECDGCPVTEWDQLTRRLLALYDRSVPAGELDQQAAQQAIEDLDFSGRDRRLARRCLIAMHRLITKHHRENQNNHAD